MADLPKNDLPKNQEELNKAAAELEKQSKKKDEEKDIFGAVVQQAKEETVAATVQEQVQQIQAQKEAEKLKEEEKEKEKEKAKEAAPITTTSEQEKEEKLKQQQFLIEEQKRQEEELKKQAEEQRKAEEQRRRDEQQKEKKEEKKEDLALVISEPTPQADFRAEQKLHKELSLDDQKSLKELLNLDFTTLQQMEPSEAIKLTRKARNKSLLVYHPDKVKRLEGESDSEFAKRQEQSKETMQKINDLVDKVIKIQESRLPNQAIDQQKVEAAKQRRQPNGYQSPFKDPRNVPAANADIYLQTMGQTDGSRFPYPPHLPSSMSIPPAAPPIVPPAGPAPGSWARSVASSPTPISSPQR